MWLIVDISRAISLVFNPSKCNLCIILIKSSLLEILSTLIGLRIIVNSPLGVFR